MEHGVKVWKIPRKEETEWIGNNYLKNDWLRIFSIEEEHQ